MPRNTGHGSMKQELGSEHRQDHLGQAETVGTTGQTAFRGFSDSVGPVSDRVSGLVGTLRGFFRCSQA